MISIVEANEQTTTCKVNVKKKFESGLFSPVQRESISTINLS